MNRKLFFNIYECKDCGCLIKESEWNLINGNDEKGKVTILIPCPKHLRELHKEALKTGKKPTWEDLTFWDEAKL